MENILRITLLYDFYSDLLTEKQRTFIDMYYFDNLTLNEIGEQFQITPQGVRDLIKRTERLLEGYESKLSLVERYLIQKNKIDNLNLYIDSLNLLEADYKNQIKHKVQEIFD